MELSIADRIWNRAVMSEDFKGLLGALEAADGTLLPSYTDMVRQWFQCVNSREKALEIIDQIRQELLTKRGMLYREP